MVQLQCEHNRHDHNPYLLERRYFPWIWSSGLAGKPGLSDRLVVFSVTAIGESFPYPAGEQSRNPFVTMLVGAMFHQQ